MNRAKEVDQVGCAIDFVNAILHYLVIFFHMLSAKVPTNELTGPMMSSTNQWYVLMWALIVVVAALLQTTHNLCYHTNVWNTTVLPPIDPLQDHDATTDHFAVRKEEHPRLASIQEGYAQCC